MRRVVLSCCILAACGKVQNGPGQQDAPAAADAPVVDAPQVLPDSPTRFASGSYSFEDRPQGNPTIPFAITATGAMMSQPSPNPGDSSGVFVVDCNLNSGAFGFGCSTSRQFIPDGLKFPVLANLGVQGRIIEFSFPLDIGSFSIAIANTDGSAQTYAVAAVSMGGADLAATQVTTTAISGWANNRATVVHAAGFRRVQVRNVGAVMNAIAIDDVRWTSD